MTFQEQFLAPRSKLSNLFAEFNLELCKYGSSGGDIQPIECTRGEIETKNGLVFTWFACITDEPLHKTKPAILMLGNGYGVEEITNEAEFRNYIGEVNRLSKL